MTFKRKGPQTIFYAFHDIGDLGLGGDLLKYIGEAFLYLLNQTCKR